VRGGVQLGPLGTAAINRPIVPAPNEYDNGEIVAMIGRGNRSTRRKPAPTLLCPPHAPQAARTRATARPKPLVTAEFANRQQFIWFFVIFMY
jgi:hypothetical protein